MQSASPKRVPLGCGPDRDRAVHPRELGKRRMRSSLASGKSATPPARCIHRPQRDTSSAGYRLLVSRASDGASRELSSRRSPALAPHTCAISPTFCYGAFLFVALALADSSSARLTECGKAAPALQVGADPKKPFFSPLAAVVTKIRLQWLAKGLRYHFGLRFALLNRLREILGAGL